MSKLALDHDAINLSQGFPDYDCDPALVALVEKYMRSGHNQYAPMSGVPALCNAIAAKVNRLHGSSYDPDTCVTVTAGATQAIFTALCCTLRPGDEVMVFEPAYDSYIPSIETLGATAVPVELHPPSYRINWDAVKSRISPKTRMIMINSPHNPTATILSEYDLCQLDELTAGTDILVLSDEVYEHLIYDGLQHQSVARYAGLRERSFIVASFGKLFHTTGWKTGYCIAAPLLMAEFRKVHQFNVFSVTTPMQYAAAEYLSDEVSYRSLPQFFQEKRDLFISLMKKTPFSLLPCPGSYFLTASYAAISNESDIDFCRRLTTEAKVAAIPLSAFYSNQTDHRIIRFCFAKKTETLAEAVNRLNSWSF
jgi:methionine aminotransferase